ncbi:trichohyalin-like [Xyrichtys novacula]|uniref:Trichohyalin-like n=1 Tax=Xyrichtys novacula TaxID=13765 RepID=A0AAV1G7L0_XYRNO|nr:trichohyalin-like [Xyrichtys novacula]
MSRAFTPESVGPLGHRPMAPLQQELASARAEIRNLRNEQRGNWEAWMDERVKLGYRIHNGKYKVNRLEGLIDVRENGFKEELQFNVQTIERLEAEIQRLNSTLKLRDEQVELIQRLQKEQEEKMWAQLKEERQKVHELQEQLFQASQEKLKAVSLSKNNETMLKLTKQQLEQRDNHIMELRREKEGLTQRLIETTTQLQNETLQKKKRKDLEEENQILKTRVSELEKMNKDLVEKEESLTFRVEEAEMAKERVIEKEKTLTDRIQELEEEKRELTHLVSLKKRRFLSRVFQKETEEEKTLRKQLKEKKKELRQLREREKEEEREQEEEQREQEEEREHEEEEREYEEEKSKNQDRGKKRVKKGLWTLRKKKNRNTRVEEVAGCSADVEEH